MTVGIAFEGCGCRAAFHVGAMEWLHARGFRPAAVAGASSGAMIAAAVAVDRTEALRPAWMTLLGTPVFQLRRLRSLRWPFVMTDLVGTASREQLGQKTMQDSNMPLSIVVTQLRGLQLIRRYITSREPIRMVRAILASCFVPGPYSRMFAIDRRPTFDGAWLNSVPIEAVHDLGCERVIACVSEDRGRIVGGLRRQPIAAPDTDHRILSPVEPLPLSTFDFHAEHTQRCFAIGRASAEHFVRTNESWLQ